MAKKPIIPDFTLALGADLREAAAKMREMSRPPAHHAASPAPETSFSPEEERRAEPPSADDGLKSAAPVPEEAEEAELFSGAVPLGNDAASSPQPVSPAQSSEEAVSFSQERAESVRLSREKPDLSAQKRNGSVTKEAKSDVAVFPLVADEKQDAAPALSRETTSAKKSGEAPLPKAASETEPAPREQGPEASLPSFPELAGRSLQRPEAKEAATGQDAVLPTRREGGTPEDEATPENPFTPSQPSEERRPPSGMEQDGQKPPFASRSLQAASLHAAPASAEEARPTSPISAPARECDHEPLRTTVTDSHQQLGTASDYSEHMMTWNDNRDCIKQSLTVINSHIPSVTANDCPVTADDCHFSRASDETSRLREPLSPERRTAAGSPFGGETAAESLASGRPPLSARPNAAVSSSPAHPASFAQPSEIPVAPPSQKVSSAVSMTVTDTNTFHESQTLGSFVSPTGVSIASAALQEAPLGGARQTLLKALDTLRGPSPQVMVNLKRLAAAIGLSYGTVRNTISRLVREGIICTTQVRTGEAHGVCIEFLDDTSLQSLTAMGAHPYPQASFAPIQSSTVINSHQQSMAVNDTAVPAPSMTSDDTSIWSADARLLADLWPYAAQAGLNPAHLAQVRRAYHVQGWDAGNVSRCLRYLDWELAQGVAAGPEHVAAWLRVMQRQGHYPRPEGYVDPEVLRLQQQAREQRELAQARQDAADARAFLDAASRTR